MENNVTLKIKLLLMNYIDIKNNYPYLKGWFILVKLHNNLYSFYKARLCSAILKT